MTPSVTAALRRLLRHLEANRQRIDRQIGGIRTILGGGADRARRATGKHFASWLGLCPDNRISGGEVPSVRTRSVKYRVAHALRLAAQTLSRSASVLGAYFRRMRAKLGTPEAITATAHELARIVYHLLTTHEAYDETRLATAEAGHRRRTEPRLRAQARALGLQLGPVTEESIS